MSSDFTITEEGVLLSVNNLCVNYASPILRDVNITVRDIKRAGATQGQIRAIVAPSGTGKSQLFKRIAGLEPPSSGSVLIGLEQVPVRAGMVGVVPQNYLLFRHHTIGSSLMLAAKMREPDTKTAHAKVIEMLETLGLADKYDSYPGELSGGQQQRISIGEQLLSSKHFLIMDEPFSGLDKQRVNIIMNLVSLVASRDDLNTVIFSTHDIENAVACADHIEVLGHEHDENDSLIPGARIISEINLIDRNLTYHPDVKHMPNFRDTVEEIEAMFPNI